MYIVAFYGVFKTFILSYITFLISEDNICTKVNTYNTIHITM